jgi:hypothetical protein
MNKTIIIAIETTQHGVTAIENWYRASRLALWQAEWVKSELENATRK